MSLNLYVNDLWDEYKDLIYKLCVFKDGGTVYFMNSSVKLWVSSKVLFQEYSQEAVVKELKGRLDEALDNLI